MLRYAALLRGIGPGNPNMTNEKLRGVFEDLGFNNVKSIISSGNIIFTTENEDATGLEELIEAALNNQLGIPGRTIIRSQAELQKMIDKNPFGNLEHSNYTYLMATFLKKPAKIEFKLPFQPTGKPYKLVAADDNTVFSVTDNTALSTTDLMGWLEKQFGKDITSRTWKTVDRILKKLNEI